RPPGRREARQRSVVPVPPVRRRNRARLGTRERGGATGRARAHHPGLGRRAAREVSPRAPPAEVRLQRRGRRPGRGPASRGRRDAPLLHVGGSAGRPRRLQGQARPRLLAVPEAAVTDLATWWRGARPRTLGAGIMPVLVGAAAAGHLIWWRLGAALLVAVGLQVGVNLANDAFDGMKGVDTPDRVGPPRLTQTGAATPKAVLVAALGSIAVAGFAGLALALVTSPALILVVGALAIVAALLYSGGPRPYAGLGLGELMVFLFFGLVATCGTSYVMVETIPASAWWCGAAMGLLA